MNDIKTYSETCFAPAAQKQEQANFCWVKSEVRPVLRLHQCGYITHVLIIINICNYTFQIVSNYMEFWRLLGTCWLNSWSIGDKKSLLLVFHNPQIIPNPSTPIIIILPWYPNVFCLTPYFCWPNFKNQSLPRMRTCPSSSRGMPCENLSGPWAKVAR